MLIIRTPSQIAKVKESSKIVAEVLHTIKVVTKVGTTTLELNALAEKITGKYNALPGFKDYKGFPFSICASRNDEVAHGFPSDMPLEDGDILSVDFGVVKDGYYGDAAITIGIGSLSAEAKKLIEITEKCLYIGIEQAIPGNKITDIGCAIQELAEKNGFNVIRQLVGHGVGKNLHERPQIKNYGPCKKGEIIKEGMTLAIEPMLTIGDYHIRMMNDGWTLATEDGSLAGHFEHTIAVTDYAPDILSLYRGD